MRQDRSRKNESTRHRGMLWQRCRGRESGRAEKKNQVTEVEGRVRRETWVDRRERERDVCSREMRSQ